MKRYVSLMIVGLLLLTTATFGQTNTDFTDVSAGSWYYDAVNVMAERGIISGYDDSTFKPMNAVHRDEFATMMVKTLNLQLSGSSSSFEDVQNDYWARKYIETAKPYLTGYSTGNSLLFKPKSQAVREDMAVALVRALNLQLVYDDTVLQTFTDYANISKNLKPFVASAVRHNVMNGVEMADGTVQFDPQGTLTRAQAAVLLEKVLPGEEKIVFDPEEKKVTFDDGTSGNTPPSGSTNAALSVETTSSGVVLNWTQPTKSGFQGYKIVASTSNQNPKYPEDGYYKWITNYHTTSATIKPWASYKKGDVGAFKPGKTYYFSITAVYDSGKYPGNAVTVTMPGEETEVEAHVTPSVSAKVVSGGVRVSWPAIDHALFTGYKVVASKSDSSPAYPEDGYYKWITNKSQTEVFIPTGDSYQGGDVGTFKADQSYYFSVTAVYADGKVAGNVIKLTMPE